jgi:two-component sensor histidine kinase
VNLGVDGADVSLGVDTAIPCGLILNELISNSLKHAFPDGRTGQIDVVFSDQQGEFALTVRDDGIGLPAEMDFRHTESLGLQLVNTLVEQLEGNIELDRSRGTLFTITFAETDLNGIGRRHARPERRRKG